MLVADRQRYERIADEVAAGAVPDLEAVFLIDADPADLGLAVSRGSGRCSTASTSSPGRRRDAARRPPIDEDDPAVIFYTSGTTGRPKGAVSTHRNMIANLQNTVFGTVVGTMTGDGAPIPSGDGDGGGARPAGGPVHLTAVPRVGLPLDARRRASWAA